MATINILPSSLNGTVTIPPSKSLAHRAILCAALSAGKTCIAPIAQSKDMEATIDAIKTLGCVVEQKGQQLLIDSTAGFTKDTVTINCGESGSTLRFLIPVVAALGIPATFIGKGRLPQRPIGTFLQLLPEHNVQCKSDGGLPMSIAGRLTAGTYTLAGNVSSQYITGLLLALPLLTQDSRIVLSTPLESSSYVDLTLSVMSHFGVEVQATDYGFFVKGNQQYASHDFTVESDWSQAAFFLAAGAINGDITLQGLSLSSLQGDRAVLPLLQDMGADIQQTEHGLHVKKSALRSTSIDVTQIPDLFPILAVACAFAEGTSKLYGAQRLRLKESDRIDATVQGLLALGITATQWDDGIELIGSTALHGGEILGYNDHRIVMAFSIATLGLNAPTQITDYESIKKSYPDFFEHYCLLGGNTHVISLGNEN